MVETKIVLNNVENSFFKEVNIDHIGNFIEIEHFGLIGTAKNNRTVGFSFADNRFFDINTGLEITNNISYFLKQNNLDCLERVIKKWYEKMKK